MSRHFEPQPHKEGGVEWNSSLYLDFELFREHLIFCFAVCQKRKPQHHLNFLLYTYFSNFKLRKPIIFMAIGIEGGGEGRSIAIVKIIHNNVDN